MESFVASPGDDSGGIQRPGRFEASGALLARMFDHGENDRLDRFEVLEFKLQLAADGLKAELQLVAPHPKERHPARVLSVVG